MQASLTARMIGAARLDTATYEAVEHDEGATSAALLVVVLGALAAGIGSLGSGRLTAFILGVIAAIVSWVVYAGIAYIVGSRLLAGPQTRATWGQLLRTLGFAQAPRLLLVVSWIPILGGLISLIVFIWTLVTTVVAIRQALDFTTGRAIVTALIAWLVMVVVYAVILAPVGLLAA